MEEGRKVAVEGSTASGHGHWAGAELRVVADRAPPPAACICMHIPCLSQREKGLGVGLFLTRESSPWMVRGRAVPLPGWLLNTATKIPDTHMAHQWDSKGRM